MGAKASSLTLLPVPSQVAYISRSPHRVQRFDQTHSMQGGSDRESKWKGVAAVGDGGVVLSGFVDGTWGAGGSQGLFDFAAAKLNGAGIVIWRWQVK